MKRTYQRSKVLDYHDLSEEQQQLANNLYDNCHNFSFVLWNNEPICLSEFEHCDKGIWDGTQALSAFSGHFIKLSKDREQAVVVYAHW